MCMFREKPLRLLGRSRTLDYFRHSGLDPFEELEAAGVLFKLIGSILQNVSQRLAELPGTDFREHISPPNLVSRYPCS